ncbi:MAG: hypothetical protein ABW109_04355 [Candidatus Thiodiazotropha sp. 6PLUC4]
MSIFLHFLSTISLVFFMAAAQSSDLVKSGIDLHKKYCFDCHTGTPEKHKYKGKRLENRPLSFLKKTINKKINWVVPAHAQRREIFEIFHRNEGNNGYDVLIAYYGKKELGEHFIKEKKQLAKDKHTIERYIDLISNQKYQFVSKEYRAEISKEFVLLMIQNHGGTVFKSISNNYPDPNFSYNDGKDFQLIQEKFVNRLKANKAKLQIKSKPEEPNYQTVKMQKDEFETTKAFKIRKAKEEAKINKENQKLEFQYKKDVTDWKKSIIKAKEKYESDSSQSEQKLEKLKKQFDNELVDLIIEKIIEQAENQYKNALIKSIKYNADREMFNISIRLNTSETKKIEAPVSIKHARKFKAIMTADDFRPTFRYVFKNKILDHIIIKEVQDPEQLLVEKAEYNKAHNSKAKLNIFINKFPHSSFVMDAQNNIEQIEQHEKEKLRKQQLAQKKREAEKRRAEQKRKEMEAYYKKKYRGEKVCKQGSVALGLVSVTISAYVENTNGDSIQLRIADTEGQSMNYNGTSLRQGVVIWDEYYQWKHCY